MKYILLTQDKLLQVISETQFNKLDETKILLGNKTNISVPLVNGSRGVVLAFFKAEDLATYSESWAFGMVKYDRCRPMRINEQSVTRIRYYNYIKNTFHVQTEHADYRQFCALWSLRTAINCIEPSKYYLIAKHVD